MCMIKRQSFFVKDPKKSTSQKSQEPSCPASSPLPGDAPPNPPLFTLETGRTTTSGQSNKPGSRRQKGKTKERGQSEDQDQTVEKEENFHSKKHDTVASGPQEEAVNMVSSPKMGVGRRTSVLFKKAKNGARLTKEKSVSLQNGVGKVENGILPHEHTTQIKLQSAKSISHSPHQLRSRGPSTCSDSEGEKSLSLPEENGMRIYTEAVGNVY